MNYGITFGAGIGVVPTILLQIQSNSNNLHIVVWFQVFLSNINNLYSIKWFQ